MAAYVISLTGCSHSDHDVQNGSAPERRTRSEQIAAHCSNPAPGSTFDPCKIQMIAAERGILCVLSEDKVTCSHGIEYGGPMYTPVSNDTNFFVPNDLPPSLEVAVGPDQIVCSMGRNNVVCWSKSSVTKTIDGLKNPRFLSVFSGGGCVITDSGLNCWSDDANFKLPIRLPSDISAVRFASATFGCVGTYSGNVVCWNPFYNYGSPWPDNVMKKPANLNGPIEDIFHYGDKICARTANNVNCFGWTWGLPSDDLSGVQGTVSDMASLGDEFSNEMCFIVNSKIRCYKHLQNPKFDILKDYNPTKGLSHPRQIVFATEGRKSEPQLCALDDNGVSCWEGVTPADYLDLPGADTGYDKVQVPPQFTRPGLAKP